MQNRIIDEDVKAILNELDLSWFSNKKILITGASGMVGFYLFRCFSDLLSTKISPKELWAISKSGIYPDQLPSNKQIKYIKVDLCDDYLTSKLPKFDVIFHAGGYAQPGLFLEDPLSTIKINTASTLALLNLLNKNGKFLFFSSSEVYSGSPNIPYKESDIGTTNTFHERAPYIEGKRCGEAIVDSARKHLNLDAVSVRLSLVYGPGTKKDDRRVLNSIINQSLNLNKINLLDDGSAQRTYCYITDAIKLSIVALLKGTESIYNVGGISEITILDLARKIAYLTQSELFPGENQKSFKSAPVQVKLNLGSIIELIGSHKFVDLDTGLARTIDWSKKIHEQQ